MSVNIITLTQSDVNAGQRHLLMDAGMTCLLANAVECKDNLLKDTRVLPIAKQVEEIHAKLMEFFQRCIAQTQTITSRLTPYTEKYLGNEMEESRMLHVRIAGLTEFQVQSAEYVDAVNLKRRSCLCHKWEVVGIPCCHVVGIT